MLEIICIALAIISCAAAGGFLIYTSKYENGCGGLVLRLRERYLPRDSQNCMYMVEFEHAGLKVRRNRYNLLWFASAMLPACAGVIRQDALFVLLGFAAAGALYPAERIGNISLPFGYLTSALRKRLSVRCEREIAENLGIIRNQIISADSAQITTDSLVEELMNCSDALKPAYIRMLSFLRTNEKKRAVEVFTEEAGCETAGEYARLLIQLDEIRPSEMYDMIASFQKEIMDARITAVKKHDEMVSDLIYLPVIANLILIFLNFIYTAYFIQQKEMLQMLF